MAGDAVVLLEDKQLDAVVFQQVDLCGRQVDIRRPVVVERVFEKRVDDLTARVGHAQADRARVFRHVLDRQLHPVPVGRFEHVHRRESRRSPFAEGSEDQVVLSGKDFRIEQLERPAHGDSLRRGLVRLVNVPAVAADRRAEQQRQRGRPQRAAVCSVHLDDSVSPLE